eukprot:9441-Heterococcus_DN1.PRE.3
MHTAERATDVICSSPEFLTFLVSAFACSTTTSKRGKNHQRVLQQPTFSLKREQAQFPTQKKTSRVYFRFTCREGQLSSSTVQQQQQQ